MIALSTGWTAAAWGGVLLVCASIDSMFCGLETGIYRLNRIRLDLRANDGDPAASTFKRMGQNFNNVLSVLLIGTNLCRYVATLAISALFMLGGSGDNTQWMTMAVATPTMFVLQDSLPKSLFQKYPDVLVYRLAGLLRWASRVFNACGVAPLVRGFAMGMLRLLGGDPAGSNLLDGVGIHTLLAEGQAHGAVTPYQSTLAERAIHITERTIADLMIPLEKTAHLPMTANRDEAIALLNRRAYAFVPLVAEDGQLVTLMDAYRLLTRPGVAPILTSTPLVHLRETLPISEALLAMQQAGHTVAGVTDQHGRSLGIVTLKDIATHVIAAPTDAD